MFGLSTARFLYGQTASDPVVSPLLELTNPAAKDQDDMCVWINRRNPRESLIICSDKAAGSIFVYDMEGKLSQTINVPKPGNIDIRQNLSSPDGATDLVVVNQRAEGFRLVAFLVDPQTRTLTRLDGTSLATGPNYGLCLAYASRTRRLYAFCTSETGNVEQYEIRWNRREAEHAKVREITLGKCEGAVADDRSGVVFIAEEAVGIWKVDVNPSSAAKPELIAGVGEHGLRGDLEGMALIDRHGTPDLLLVSDQGRSSFAAFDARSPHNFIGAFDVQGARESDGIEVVSVSLGEKFEKGLFLCHTDRSTRPVLVAPLAEIIRHFERLRGEGRSNPLNHIP